MYGIDNLGANIELSDGETQIINLGNNIYFVSKIVGEFKSSPIFRWGVYERYNQVPLEWILKNKYKITKMLSLWSEAGDNRKDFSGWIFPVTSTVGYGADNSFISLWFKDIISDAYNDMGVQICFIAIMEKL